LKDKEKEFVDEESNRDLLVALDANMERNFGNFLFKAEVEHMSRTADTIKVLVKAFPMAIL
jgi:hypothetical protein